MTEAELAAMLANDEHHWWYRGRRRVLAAVLDGLELPPRAAILDAGCGSGRTLDDLARRGTVCGVDTSATAVEAARRRGHRDVHVAAVEDLPFGDRAFDLVTCLDVIEHTPDDRATLAELLRVTRPGGVLVATVPAYQSLFSAHDLINGHYRRYRAATLRAAAVEAGWSAVSDTHFNAVLLAPAAMVRIARRHRASNRSELTFTPRMLDRALERPMAREARLIANGHRLPFGLSLLMVLRRPGALYRLWSSRTVSSSAGKNASIESSETVTSTAVPNVV
jgi:SAM-dependent methyltransferase